MRTQTTLPTGWRFPAADDIKQIEEEAGDFETTGHGDDASLDRAFPEYSIELDGLEVVLLGDLFVYWSYHPGGDSGAAPVVLAVRTAV